LPLDPIYHLGFSCLDPHDGLTFVLGLDSAPVSGPCAVAVFPILAVASRSYTLGRFGLCAPVARLCFLLAGIDLLLKPLAVFEFPTQISAGFSFSRREFGPTSSCPTRFRSRLDFFTRLFPLSRFPGLHFLSTCQGLTLEFFVFFAHLAPGCMKEFILAPILPLWSSIPCFGSEHAVFGLEIFPGLSFQVAQRGVVRSWFRLATDLICLIRCLD
jgi:hypothetical protein